MRTPLSCLAGALFLAAASASPSAAQQPLAEQVLEGCASELEAHCAAVTPGEGRLLARPSSAGPVLARWPTSA